MEKKEIIKQIEKKRDSRIISYVTSDRPGPLNARVAMDVIPILSRQLREIGKVQKLDLFLYSAGGDTLVPWRLVSMIREYCDFFSVLVPYKAHSAATMIALGADEIIMSDLSELSPIDPSTTNTFNPFDPNNPAARIPISVEDVVAFMSLAKDKFGIKNEAELCKIFSKFIEANPQIHPLALGNVNRIHNLIRLIAKRLLKSQKNHMRDDDMEKVIEYFTEKLYSHQYFIGRKEASQELGLKSVVSADAETASLMTDLYEKYVEEMDLGQTTWNPEVELGDENEIQKNHKIAFIEGTSSNFFELTIEYKRERVVVSQQTQRGQVQIPQSQVSFRILRQGWQKNVLSGHE